MSSSNQIKKENMTRNQKRKLANKLTKNPEVSKVMTDKENILAYMKSQGTPEHEKKLEHLIWLLTMSQSPLSQKFLTGLDLDALIKDHNQFMIAEAIGRMRQKELKK
jgi:hypothetical protein